jgi:hypothetical protein
MRALFGDAQARPVEDQHALTRRHALPQLPPDPVRRPRGIRHEVLQCLIAARIADAREHRAHRLARAIAQDAEQVSTKRSALRHVAERRLERLQPRQQPIDPRGRIRRQHDGDSVPKFAGPYNVLKSDQRGIRPQSRDLTK